MGNNKRSIEEKVKPKILTEDQFDRSLDEIKEDLADELYNLEKLKRDKEKDKKKYNLRYMEENGVITYLKIPKRRIGFRFYK